MVYILIDHRNDVNMLKTQSFEHFDVICMVDKSTDHRKLLFICYFHTIDNFDVHFRWRFSERSARKKEKSKLRHHHVISMVCTLNGAHCKRYWKPMDASRSFVFGQLRAKVSAGFTNVSNLTVAAFDLVYCSLSVIQFFFVLDISK